MISTGSQGEPLSALRRMANNDHRDVELHSGDTVVFSATPVPGQRARRQRNDRPHLRDRRHRGDRQRRADPRLRPRLAGGAEADDQPDQAEIRAADPRRLQAPAPALRTRPVGRDRRREHLPGPQRPGARTRRERRPLRRGHRRRRDLRRRRQRRRARRRRPARPAGDLRRRDLHRRRDDLLRRRQPSSPTRR